MSAAQLERIVARKGRAPVSHCTHDRQSLALRTCGAHHLQRSGPDGQLAIRPESVMVRVATTGKMS
jgi:hypothetical protein